jgi:CubicO group peptidase (beta-lactamase class C family)
MRSFLLLFLLVPVIGFSQSRKAALEKIMNDAGIPGMQLAYIKNGRLSELYNLGVRSNDTRATVDSATIFDAASLSKCVFAYGVLKLAEAGKLDLDKPLHHYLDYEDLKHDTRYQKITARQTLSHTSGLPNWRNGPKLNFQYDPGQRYRYSGEGFVLLSKVVEKITGMPIAPWMQQTVLEPLGMNNSSYVWDKRFDNDYAQPHNDVGKTASKNFPSGANMAYSLQTTAADYAKFMSVILSRSGLKKATYDQLFTPQHNSWFPEHPQKLAWGLGVGYAKLGDVPAFWQWGDNGAFKGYMTGFPTRQEGLVFFTNSQNGLAAAKQILELFFSGEHTPLKWLDYWSYTDPQFQLRQKAMTGPFMDAVRPFFVSGTQLPDTNQLKEGSLNNIGFRLLNMRRFNDARQAFEINLKLNPGSAPSHAGLGMVSLREGNWPEAAQFFNRAHALDSSEMLLKRTADRLLGKADTSRGIGTVFMLPDYMNAHNVQLVGTFNGWNDVATPMRWENGSWRTSINLRPGTYQYKFVVDGVWISDTRNPKVKTDSNLDSVIEIPENK